MAASVGQAFAQEETIDILFLDRIPPITQQYTFQFEKDIVSSEDLASNKELGAFLTQHPDIAGRNVVAHIPSHLDKNGKPTYFNGKVGDYTQAKSSFGYFVDSKDTMKSQSKK